MFEKVLIAEDQDVINNGVIAILEELEINNISHSQYCDEAMLKLKRGQMDEEPYDLLISDLSFKKDHVPQKLTSGIALIEEVRKEFPNLKIIVFSIEDKSYQIQKLHDFFSINGYIWKNRDGARELKKSIQHIYSADSFYISPDLKGAMSSKNSVDITDYDVFIIESLSKGLLQGGISKLLKEKGEAPASVSAIEKRLKFLKEQFNANNATHLVSIAKDSGLI